MIGDDTKRATALKAVYRADDPVTAGEAREQSGEGFDLYEPLRSLHEDGYVDREGDGGPTDPYRYTVTSKGQTAAADLIEDGDPKGSTDEDSGLDVLFPDTDTDTFRGRAGTDSDDDAVDPDDYTMLPNDATVDDIEPGTRYRVEVNNTETYGVFVSFNTAQDYDDEVTGLVHRTRIPNGYAPEDFAEGDDVGVMLVGMSDKGPELELVAAFNTMRNHEFETDPVDAPTLPDGIEDVDQDSDTVTVDDSDDSGADSDPGDEPDQSPTEDTKPDHDPDSGDSDDDVADAIDDLREQIDALAESVSHLSGRVTSAQREAEAAHDTALTAKAEALLPGDDLSDDDRVDAIYLIAQSDSGSYTKKTRLIRSLMGLPDADTDSDDGGSE